MHPPKIKTYAYSARILIITIIGSCLGIVIAEKPCTDLKGRNISIGNEPCTHCTCNNGTPGVCIAYYCPPPEKCRPNAKLNDKCCDILCLGVLRDNSNKDGSAETLTPTNLGLRLVASAVTSFLILALLLFMIHRLRQRRLLLVIRQQIAGLNAHRLDSTNLGGQHYSNDDEGNVGYFVGHDHLDFGSYDEPPPPYSFWKPSETYIPTGEAPPPYEVTIRYPPPSISVSPTNGTQQGRLFPRPDHATDSRSPSTGVGTQVLLGLSLVGDRRPSSDGRVSRRSSQISPGVFSTNEQGESTCSSDINYGRGPILESDARYEDITFARNNVTVLHLNGACQSTSYNLCEDDIVNGNVLISTPGVESSSASSSLGRTGRSSSSKSQDSRTGNRCHSYCEGLGQWRAEQTNQKQTVIGGSNNNVVPDPTAWIGDTTDTSTSASPSSEQQTVSPSSSDTSGDGEFVRNNAAAIQNYTHKAIERPKQKLISFSSGVDTAPKGSGLKKPSSMANIKEKRNSLERTLKQLKRLSLPTKKKAYESSASCSKTASSSSALPCLPSLGRENRSGNRNSAASISESSCSSSASPEALDENKIKLIPEESSSKFQQNRCRHVWHRPASLNLNSYYISNARSNANIKTTRYGSDPSSKCSTDSSADSAPPTGTNLSTTFNHLQRSITPRDSFAFSFPPPTQCVDPSSSRPMSTLQLIENRPRIITPDSIMSPESAAQQQQCQRRAAIARSSSICSETGERNPRRLSLNIVHTHGRHGSDSTPENFMNTNSPPTGGDNNRLDNLRLPPNKFGRSCSSESNNSST